MFFVLPKFHVFVDLLVSKVEVLKELRSIANDLHITEFPFSNTRCNIEDVVLMGKCLIIVLTTGNDKEMIEVLLSMHFEFKDIYRPYLCNVEVPPVPILSTRCSNMPILLEFPSIPLSISRGCKDSLRTIIQCLPNACLEC